MNVDSHNKRNSETMGAGIHVLLVDYAVLHALYSIARHDFLSLKL